MGEGAGERKMEYQTGREKSGRWSQVDVMAGVVAGDKKKSQARGQGPG